MLQSGFVMQPGSGRPARPFLVDPGRVYAKATFPTMKKPPRNGTVFMEVAGVEPASPNVCRECLQVCPSIQVVGEWVAERRAFTSVPRKVSLLPSGSGCRQASVGLQTSPPLKAAQWEVRRPALLTQRGRGCRCCWHVKGCRMLGGRRLHLQPATLTGRVETGAPPKQNPSKSLS